MGNKLTLDKFLQLAKEGKKVAVYREIYIDTVTTISAYEVLSKMLGPGAILESELRMPGIGQYSFLAFDLIAQLSAIKHHVTVKMHDKVTEYNEHPFTILRNLMKELAFISSSTCELLGNAVGYFAYDAIRLFENIPDRHSQQHHLPDIFFNFYRTTLKFDHERKTLLITTHVEIKDDPSKAYYKAEKMIDDII
jgi:anthranilate synthase component 1